MSKPLIIAEKPSVAREIAAALGSSVRRDGYLETNDYFITNCIGHLFTICEPKEHNPDWEQWRKEKLPMIPETFRYKPNASTAAQWKTVRGLLDSDNVSYVINACDAGREGELIFWLAYNHASVRKPVKRLWISSLTADAVRKGFTELKDASVYQGLTDSAFLRQIADWLIGLNGTRAFTLSANVAGQVFSLGRVQTPTLALIVDRDNEIENFVSRPFFNVSGVFAAPDAASNASSTNFPAYLADAEMKFRRFDDSAQADAVVNQLRAATGAPRLKSIDRKEFTIKQPLLFDLTALQREMNVACGLTAAKTLEVAQSLYEKKFLTYPRTKSAYLSQTVFETDVPKILEKLQNYFSPEISACAAKIKQNDWLKLSSRHVNDAKVTEHDAIIPTSETPTAAQMDADETKVYDAVTKRFLAAFYPAGVDERTRIVIELGGFPFVAKGVVVRVAGWREILKNFDEREKSENDSPDADADATILPPLTETSTVALEAIKKIQGETRPPKRYNESSLLGAMETAGRTLEDEDARQAMKDLGLGTPATRAETIEKLIRQQYVERNKSKQLVSTSKARQVIKNLKSLGSILVSPELTGTWERQLELIAAGKADKSVFESSVRKLAAKIVADIFSKNLGIALDNLDKCPLCACSGRAPAYLKEIKAESGKYLVCSAGRDVCGFISSVPATKKQKEMMLAAKCPECAQPMVFRLSKSGTVAYLGCSTKDCRGVIWFENKKKGGKGKFKTGAKEKPAKI